MKLSSVQKLGGISIITGSLLLVIWTILWTFCLPSHGKSADLALTVQHGNWLWITSLSFTGVVLMVFGFTSVYSCIYDKTGLSGLLGYVFIVLSYMHQGSKVTWELFIYPVLANYTPELLREGTLFYSPLVSIYRNMFYLLIIPGLVFLCMALIKSKIFPKVSVILISAGAVMYALGPMINVYIAIAGVTILSSGCIVLGRVLLKD